MPLTPEDVRNKEFSTVKLREGYNVDEVDAFLDEVEAELARLLRENSDLRQKLAAVQGGPGQVPHPAEASVEERPTAEPEPAAQPEPVRAENVAEAATGILALAQRTADEHVAAARAEADKLVGDARGQAERLVSDAQARAERLRREAEERHREVMGTLEHDRVNLERRLEELRAFEREYRNRLKTYLQTQLRELEAGAAEVTGPGQSPVDRAPFAAPVGGPVAGPVGAARPESNGVGGEDH